MYLFVCKGLEILWNSATKEVSDLNFISIPHLVDQIRDESDKQVFISESFREPWNKITVVLSFSKSVSARKSWQEILFRAKFHFPFILDYKFQLRTIQLGFK